MTRADWNLLVLAAAERPVTPVQLQKVLFLLGQNVSRDVLGNGFYRFKAHNYGPFSPSVYSDAEEMAATGLVVVGNSAAGYKEFRATSAGLQKAAELRTDVSGEIAAYIKSLTDWAQSLSFDQLVRSIYNAYPAFKANSIFSG